MSDEIEMQTLENTLASPFAPAAFAPEETMRDPAIATWAYASAGLLAFFSLPLLLFPRVLLFLASPPTDLTNGRDVAEVRSALTPLESFLATYLGVFMLAYATGLLLNTSSASPIAPRAGTEFSGHPFLAPLTAACTILAFVSYNTKNLGSFSLLSFLLNATVGVWGLWETMFQGTARLSKKTGADKHTSAFLFANKAAASSRKKEWKKSH